jgi:hypothetical protein
MKVNFGELLSSQRVGPLWGRSVGPESALHALKQILQPAQPGGGPSGAGTPTSAESHPASQEGPLWLPQDLADVPIEPPHQLLDALEDALLLELGPRAAMLRSVIEALRVRIHRLDPTADAPPFHPLRHAAGGTIPQLLYRLEDTLRGLRRVAGK